MSSVKLEPAGVIIKDLGLDKNGRVQKFFTNTCRRYMEPYVPKDSGNLRDNVEETSNSVIYNSPYAHYQYMGLAMGPSIPIMKNGIAIGFYSPKGKSKYYTGKSLKYHGGGGAYWDKRMWSAHKDQVINETQKYMEGK